MEDEDLAAMVRAFRTRMEELGGQFQDAFEKVSEDFQERVDTELARAMARNPELYAELRKSYRQVKRTFEKVGRDLGLK